VNPQRDRAGKELLFRTGTIVLKQDAEFIFVSITVRRG
jgi:hypothetical protein